MQHSPVSRAVENTPEIESVGTEVKNNVRNLIMQNGATRHAADLLHGTWLGHPLHPLLTDMTVGSWTLSTLFDVLGLLGSDDDFAHKAADTLVNLGLVAAVPTILSGLADYSAIKRDAVKTGIVHGMANGTAFVMFLFSMWARKGKNRALAILFSLVGLAFMTLGAYLGGDLAYRKKVGVNHAESVERPAAWLDVMPAENLPPGQKARVEVAGYPVLLYRHDDIIHAIGAVCSHAGGPLEQGMISEDCVTCPWHASVFDLRDGSIVHGPAVYPQPDYHARIHEGSIQIMSA
ncbi:MAG: Rieske 2Fe-2S domain-containing protein [Chloroflexi bacterium]|nr:Rieske 2Fe-2S domain-containing protein [Chloroflexota bacterium]